MNPGKAFAGTIRKYDVVRKHYRDTVAPTTTTETWFPKRIASFSNTKELYGVVQAILNGVLS